MCEAEAIKKRASAKELKHYYQEIIKNIPNIVYILDSDANLFHGNLNFLSLVGAESIEDLPVNFYSALVQHAGFSEVRVNMLREIDLSALSHQEAQYNFNEPPVIDKQGNILYFRSNRIPVFDQENNLKGLMVVLVDNSVQKKMEQAFEKISIQLQKQLKYQQTTPFPPSVVRMPNSPPTILMVEDNPLAQQAVSSVLEKLNCKVEIADSGTQAYKAFKAGKFDLVIMDIGLQDSSGYMVSKKIRQLEKNSGYRVPIVALTAYDADTVKEDCHHYCMEGAITKPLTSAQAKQLIKKYVHQLDTPVDGMKSISGYPISF